ncbi:MAG: hypothetical protein CBARDMAM_0623 [uncultured Caballeronia sp.]|nr:MAG: hypothetical protein CBARDMAM_0623 [uncultured Caballeronia sp.]
MSGNTLHDANPSVVLYTTVGDTLNLFDNGVLIGSMVVTEANTKWGPPTLSNGVHNLSITETNTSGTSAPLTLSVVVDSSTAPAAHSLVSAVNAASQDVTAVSNDASVDLHDKVVASASHQSIDLNVDPALYSKQSTAYIEGGSSGAHTLLYLEGSHEVLDLTSLTGKTASAKISGSDVADLGGHGNIPSLSIADFLNLGQPELLHDGNKQMMVNGSASDMIDLLHAKVAGVADAPWVQHDTASVGGVTYNVYQDAAAHADLLIQQSVQVAVH